MKLSGRELKRNVETIVIPRGNDDPIIFYAHAITDFSDLEKYLKLPEAPAIKKPGQAVTYNYDDPDYKVQLDDYHEKRIAWIVIASLQATTDLEWENVKLDNPDTWLDYEKEFREAGFVNSEILRVIEGCLAANALSQTRIDEARERFLSEQSKAQLSQ